MKTNELAQAAECIQKEMCGQDSLSLLIEIIDRGDAPILVTRLVELGRSSGKDERSAVTQAMRSLESLARLSPWIACTLMAYLWPLSSDLRMHDIWDAIGLWIVGCDAEELTKQLTRICQSEGNRTMRSKYEELLRSRESDKK